MNNAITKSPVELLPDSGESESDYSRAAIFFGNDGRILATITNANPIAAKKKEKNCPRVNPAIKLASGSRKFSTTIRKMA
jgi:hypothetical protein